MYNLNVINNYVHDIVVNVKGSGDTIVNHNSEGKFDKLGNVVLDIFGMGHLSLFDLGEKKLPEYDFHTQTWGVLIRYKTTEAYYRYEGGGQLSIIIDEFGSVSLSTNSGQIINIKLKELTI